MGLVRRAVGAEPQGHAQECDSGTEVAAGDAAEEGEAPADADG